MLFWIGYFDGEVEVHGLRICGARVWYRKAGDLTTRSCGGSAKSTICRRLRWVEAYLAQKLVLYTYEWVGRSGEFEDVFVQGLEFS